MPWVHSPHLSFHALLLDRNQFIKSALMPVDMWEAANLAATAFPSEDRSEAALGKTILAQLQRL